MKPAWLILFGSVVFAAGSVEGPSVGYALGGDGSIVRVSGVAGAFIAGATGQTAVVSAGFSKQLAVLKLSTTVRVLDGVGNTLNESDAPNGPALFGFDAQGGTAIAYYPSTQALTVFRGGAWNPVPFQAGRVRVLAVALKDADRALVVLARDLPGAAGPTRSGKRNRDVAGRLSLARIRTSDGATEDEVIIGPGAGPVHLASQGGLLYQRESTLVYRGREGNEQILDVPAEIVDLVEMGDGWVQARTASGRSLAIRLGPEVRVYSLPEVAQ